MKKMKRLPLFLALLLLVSALAPAALAAGVTVTVNGETVEYTAETGTPYVENGAVMIPVAQTMLAYGLLVDESAAPESYALGIGTREVFLVPGKAYLLVNGSQVSVPAATALKGGVLYASAKELVNGLGGLYTWDGATFAIDSQLEDSYFAALEKGEQLSSYDFWNVVWPAANNARSEKRWADAIPLYEQVIPNMLHNDDGYNGIALTLGRLAECYAKTGQYRRAAAAYARSSIYWDLKGDTQTSLKNHILDRNLRDEVALYLKTDDPAYSLERTHGVPYEPTHGIVLGYTHDDLVNDYETTSQKHAGIWLTYFYYGVDDINSTENTFKIFNKTDRYIIELAVQPMKGLASVNDETTRVLAQALHDSGGRFIVRFANEMNDSSNIWYTANGEEYKAAYIRFAKVMREVCPEAALLWSPNFYPENNVDDYYPGDEWVDYVGISSYIFARSLSAEQVNAGYDPLGLGYSTQRWSQQIDFLYNKYGWRKPLMISEGAASYLDRNTQADIADFAAGQVKDFYTYLPIKYPNLKYAVYFNVNKDKTKYLLSDRAQVLSAYNAAIADETYISGLEGADGVTACYVPFSVLGQERAIPQTGELSAFVKYADDSLVKAVRYYVNGEVIGTRSSIPYTAPYDFSAYAGQTVTITASALSANGTVLTSRKTLALVAENEPAPIPEPEPEPALIAYESRQTVELDGEKITLPAYALKDEKGNDTNFVRVRDLADLLNGTPGQFDVIWTGAVDLSAKTPYDHPNGTEGNIPFTGNQPCAVYTGDTKVNGEVTELEAFVITWEGGGHTYYKLRDLGKALGFNVSWSADRGIYIETDKDYVG